ncbi:MAG: AAA family ATPase, partial [Thermoplasmata archaeon]
MLIKRIELENIRSYIREEINFDSGLLFIEGDIGAGKTTILMAIKFALFGGGKESGIKYGEMLREGAREGRVKLYFTLDGKEYAIERKLKREKEKIEQDKDVKIEEEGGYRYLSPKGADEEIMKIIGMKKGAGEKKGIFARMYKFALYVPQESMKEIIAPGSKISGEKRETISKIFGCDAYKRAEKNASEVRERMKQKISVLMAQLGENYVELERRRDAMEKERKEREEKQKQVELTKKRIEVIEKECEELGKNLKKYEEEKRKIEKLEREKSVQETRKRSMLDEMENEKKEISELEMKIEEAKRNLEVVEPRYREYEALKHTMEEENKKREKYQEIKEEFLQKKGKLEGIKKEIGKEDELRKRMEEIGNVAEELDTLRNEKEKNTTDIAKISKEIEKLQEKVAKNEKEKKDFADLTGKKYCPKCRQELSREHVEKIIAELEEEIAKGKEEIAEKNSEIEKLKARKGYLENAIKEKQKLEKEYNEIQRMLDEIVKKKEDADILEREIENLAGEMMETGYDEERFREIEKKIKEMQGVEEKYTKFSTELQGMNARCKKLKENLDLRETE